VSPAFQAPLLLITTPSHPPSCFPPTTRKILVNNSRPPVSYFRPVGFRRPTLPSGKSLEGWPPGIHYNLMPDLECGSFTLSFPSPLFLHFDFQERFWFISLSYLPALRLPLSPFATIPDPLGSNQKPPPLFSNSFPCFSSF